VTGAFARKFLAYSMLISQSQTTISYDSNHPDLFGLIT